MVLDVDQLLGSDVLLAQLLGPDAFRCAFAAWGRDVIVDGSLGAVRTH